MLLQNTTVVNHSSTIITKYTEYTCMKESKMHYQTKEDAELWVLLIKGDKLALDVPALLSAPVELWTYNLHKRRINKRLYSGSLCQRIQQL